MPMRPKGRSPREEMRPGNERTDDRSRERRSAGNRSRNDESGMMRHSASDGRSFPLKTGGGGSMGRLSGPNNGNFNASAGAGDAPEMPKKKFTGRCRLFVGNLPSDVKESELKDLFKVHGEISECFLSGKGFAFLRMDTRAHAESAKEAIDGISLRNRSLRVRFAVHGASIRVKELSPYVSNELLYQAFSNFGEVERAVHIVDEKGRPTGEGIVEFERKPSAAEALRQCKDGIFLMTSNPKPIIAEHLEPKDEDDGLSERMISRTQSYMKERELGPRIAQPGSFELHYGQRWKEVFEMEKVKRDQLEAELRESRERLESDMELAYQDYQTQLLREDLERRQHELERLEAAKRDRMDAARRREEERMNAGMGMRGGGLLQPQDEVPPSFFGSGPQPPNMAQQQHQQQQQQQQMFGRPGGPPSGPDYGAPFQGPNPMMGAMGQPFESGPPRGPPPQIGGTGPQGRPDPNLVQGVQKLLQMFKGQKPGGGHEPGPMHGVGRNDQPFGAPNFPQMAFHEEGMGPGGKRRRH